MINLPTGTVTFLFTDIQGSTDLAQKYPDALPALLARHHAILRGAMEAHDGIVFRIAGDSFSCAFDKASDALAAAIDAQRWLNTEAWSPAPIRVRMGINTGDAHAKGLDNLGSAYEGYSTLARVARVMALAHGGQILLANSTAELVRDHLPQGISLREMGEHKLKGFISAERLWQVVAPDLPNDFPPLQSSDDMPSNLPATLNRLVGRTEELEQVKARLTQTRLLTLLGPGGTGKTRLALQAASELRSEFQDRVYFIDLASSRDSNAAVAAIARTLGVRESSDKPLLDELKGQIKNKKILSLLDNFEQVTVAAPTMAELLRDCPELKMLVTSREALHVRGENVFPVPPLELPPIKDKHVSLEQIAQCEAVQLFVERAQQVNPDFELTEENAQAVAEICLRVDGLPLAIELATARLNVFSPQALAERLSRHLGSSSRLKILRGGARDLPARQQTLRDTIDWSYEMLRAEEQHLFALLSVFSGATVEAVETAVNETARFEDADVIEIVSSLADKSLIRQDNARLRMLETIREFAAARLDEDAEFRARAERAHANYFAEFAKREWKNLTGEKRDAALQRLTTELDNMQTAWQFWAAESNLEQLRKLADTLWYLYDARGWAHASVELISQLLKILETTASTPERLREEILLQTSLARAIQSTQGYTQEVEQAYQRALELCDKAGQVPELLPVLRGLATFHTMRMEHAQALALGERIVQLAERLGESDMATQGQMVVGYSLASLDRPHEGHAHLEKAIALYDPKRQRPRRLGIGANEGVIALNASAMYLWMMGYPERARQRMDEAVALAFKLDHPFSVCYGLFHHSLLNLWLGFPEVTRERTRALLELTAEHEFQIWSAVGTCVRGMALVMLGSIDQGVRMIEDGIHVYRALKTPPIFYPILLSMQASAYGIAARPQEGMPLINEALQLGAQVKGKVFAPELMGAVAELLVALNNSAEAEQLLQAALQISQELQTTMLELRAAMKLSRLWQQQGKTEQARNVLQNAYAKMTEGFEMPDLVQAQALLQELG
jgi:predicted ATPase/class 3 adenylate cyclase